MSVERLTLARLALSKLLEIYSPTHVGRTEALAALRGGVEEFETAVREDERAIVLANQLPQLPLTPAADAPVTDVPAKADKRK